MKDVTDQDLQRLWMERRDALAFQEISRRHASRVYATCSRILGRSADAEDVAQECFQQFALNVKEPLAYLGAWLHRVATNRSLKIVRSRRLRRAREERFARTRESAADKLSFEPDAWEHICGVIDEALEELAEEERLPVVLHFLEGRSHHEVARSLGVPRSTVSYRIQKGVASIRRFLKRRGVSLGGGALSTLMGEQLIAGPAPKSLVTSLGKLALSGASSSTLAGGTFAALLGGLLMKKVLVAAAAALVVSLTAWQVVQKISDPAPVQVASPRIASETRSAPDDSRGEVPGENTRPAAPVIEIPKDPIAESPPPVDPSLASISGFVVDAAASEGLGDVEVTLRPDSDGLDQTLRTRTVDSGDFRFDGLAEGSYRLGRTWAPGFPRFVRDDELVINVAAGEHLEDARLVVDFGFRVSGRVVDADGRPVSGAHVE